jgi:hypothetical protein
MSSISGPSGSPRVCPCCLPGCDSSGVAVVCVCVSACWCCCSSSIVLCGGPGLSSSSSPGVCGNQTLLPSPFVTHVQERLHGEIPVVAAAVHDGLVES